MRLVIVNMCTNYKRNKRIFVLLDDEAMNVNGNGRQTKIEKKEEMEMKLRLVRFIDDI